MSCLRFHQVQAKRSSVELQPLQRELQENHNVLWFDCCSFPRKKTKFCLQTLLKTNVLLIQHCSVQSWHKKRRILGTEHTLIPDHENTGIVVKHVTEGVLYVLSRCYENNLKN